MRRLAICAIALVALSLLLALGPSTALEQAPAPPPPPSGPPASFGTFAGYVTSANVKTISAEWRVPKLMPLSRNGEAATWIGAQGRNSQAPFVQVGTIESQIDGETIHPIEADSAFWSDTELHFYPVAIPGLVHGGDLISAEMADTTHGWQLRIVNETEHWARSIPALSAAAKGYGEAEWIQEDPEDPITKSGVAYPELSPANFQGVGVNGQYPHPSLADALWMSENNRVLAPGSFQDGRFEVTSLRLTQAQTQYMRDARPVNVAAAETNYVVPYAHNSSLNRYLAALAQFSAQLRQQSWPRSTESQVGLMVSDERQYGSSLRALFAAGKSASNSIISREAATSFRNAEQANRFRLSIGLPPTIELTVSEAKS
jgi:Peptidase A4 family